jgi:hypothetical protein
MLVAGGLASGAYYYRLIMQAAEKIDVRTGSLVLLK